MVFERTSAEEVRDDPLSVVANGFHIECSHVVIATHNPLAGLAGAVSATLLQTTLQLYTTYVVASRVAPGRVPDALFWDTDDPYRYLRVDRRRGFDVVLLGGEDHKTGQNADTEVVYDRLASTLRAMVPDADITHRWSGQVIETTDGLPMMGWTAPHQFVATGFAGNGMTFGTLGGMMARDAILEQKNPWSDLFDIHRNKVGSHVWDYLKENSDYPYYMFRDRFAGAQGKSIRALQPGQGAVVETKGSKVAAYRDINGALILRSAICTHMGCVVQWNTAERTWDCPCHGSRFNADGSVKAGPAEKPLAPA
jgi:Rieske Fe-S protein